MSRLAILPLGIGEYFTRKYFNSNFLLFLDDKIVAVDCPGPYRRILSEGAPALDGKLDYDQIDTVILTHLHGDHSNGLEELLLYRYYVINEKTDIYTSKAVGAELWDNKLSASLAYRAQADCSGYRDLTPDLFYNLHDCEFGDSFELYGARFEIQQTRHPVPTFGFRCWFGDKSLAYSCDTAFNMEYIEWLGECDFVIHECNTHIHTPYTELLTVDPSILKKMHLIHISDEFDEAASKIPVLEQGKLLEL
jgi:ribonuclease BN (tRNA processing enzyme)